MSDVKIPATGFPWMPGFVSDVNRNIARAPFMMPTAVADAPDPLTNRYGWIFVTDETGGATPAFSDGTNWRRVSDLAVIST